DSRANGDAGKVILWSDGHTRFAGDVSARALGVSGVGGFVEVSGKESLHGDGLAASAAANGRHARRLLAPGDLGIGAAVDAVNYLNTGTLVTALGSNNVVVSTGSTALPGETGTITVSSAVSWSTVNDLALLAHGDIRFNASVQNTRSTSDGGSLTL